MIKLFYINYLSLLRYNTKYKTSMFSYFDMIQDTIHPFFTNNSLIYESTFATLDLILRDSNSIDSFS